MKLLFDQNLSHWLVTAISDLYPGSSHVRPLGLMSAGDDAVWEYAKQNGFTIASKDNDFLLRSLLFGHPPKVVLVALGNCPTNAVHALLRARRAEILAFERDPNAAYLILA
jgi:predicted nuclease of predicted toxin-antitoxin system